MEYEEKSLKSQFSRADKAKSPYVVIVGTEELKKDQILIRNLNTQSQETCRSPNFWIIFWKDIDKKKV